MSTHGDGLRPLLCHKQESSLENRAHYPLPLKAAVGRTEFQEIRYTPHMLTLHLHSSHINRFPGVTQLPSEMNITDMVFDLNCG